MGGEEATLSAAAAGRGAEVGALFSLLLASCELSGVSIGSDEEGSPARKRGDAGLAGGCGEGRSGIGNSVWAIYRLGNGLG